MGLTENESKKRWRSLRDGFIKHVKQHDEETRGSTLHYDTLKLLPPHVTGDNARTRTPSSKQKRKQNVVSNIIYIQNDTDENGTQYIRAMDDDVEGSMEDMDVHELTEEQALNPKTETTLEVSTKVLF